MATDEEFVTAWQALLEGKKQKLPFKERYSPDMIEISIGGSVAFGRLTDPSSGAQLFVRSISSPDGPRIARIGMLTAYRLGFVVTPALLPPPEHMAAYEWYQVAVRP